MLCYLMAVIHTFWRRKWQPTPVFLPEKFHGWRSLESYSPWGHKESDKTEWSHRKTEKITFSYYSSKLHESLLIGDKRCEELLHILWFKYHWMLWMFLEEKKILRQNIWKLKGNKVSLAYLHPLLLLSNLTIPKPILPKSVPFDLFYWGFRSPKSIAICYAGFPFWSHYTQAE